MPLVTPGYTTPQMISAWIAALDRDPPAAIIDAEASNPHWEDGEDFLRPPPPGSAGGRNLDILEPFRDWVRARYVLVEEIDGRHLYLRR